MKIIISGWWVSSPPFGINVNGECECRLTSRARIVCVCACVFIVFAMQTVFLIIMVAEAVTVAVREKTHFRITRALRPLFLLDSYYCMGARR